MFSEWILNWDSGGWEVSLILLPRVKSVIAFFWEKTAAAQSGLERCGQILFALINQLMSEGEGGSGIYRYLYINISISIYMDI